MKDVEPLQLLVLWQYGKILPISKALGGENVATDRLQKIDEQMAKLKAQKQAILNRERAQERKDRTRRLIQMGAVIEKYFDIHTVEEAEALSQIATADHDKLENLKRMIKTKSIEILAEKQKENPAN